MLPKEQQDAIELIVDRCAEYGCYISVNDAAGAIFGQTRTLDMAVRNVLDWHAQIEEMTAELSKWCLIGDRDISIILMDRIAYQAKEISIRGLFPASTTLTELFDGAKQRLASGETIETVGVWLDSLVQKGKDDEPYVFENNPKYTMSDRPYPPGAHTFK